MTEADLQKSQGNIWPNGQKGRIPPRMILPIISTIATIISIIIAINVSLNKFLPNNPLNYAIEIRIKPILILASLFAAIMVLLMIYIWLFPWSYRRYILSKVRGNAIAATKEISRFSLEPRHKTERDFMKDVEEALNQYSGSDLRISALCGYKPWGQNFVNNYFNNMYRLAAELYDNEPIVTRIFVEPESGFEQFHPDTRPHRELWFTIVRHHLYKGVCPKIIPKERKHLLEQISAKAKDFYAGLGFIVIHMGEVKLSYVHHGEGKNFRYAKWGNENAIREVLDAFDWLSEGSEDFKPEKFVEMLDIEVPINNEYLETRFATLPSISGKAILHLK